VDLAEYTDKVEAEEAARLDELARLEQTRIEVSVLEVEALVHALKIEPEAKKDPFDDLLTPGGRLNLTNLDEIMK